MAARTRPRLGPAPWLGPALRAQSRAAAALSAAFCLAALLGASFGMGAQLAVLLGAIVLTGVPHGAFDHLVARPVLAPRLGRLWWAPFGAGYLGLAGLVWLAWAAAPAATLAGFLCASVLHFGLGDTEDGLAPAGVPRALSVAAYGALPVLPPMALHPAEAAPVLAALAEVPVAAMEAALRHAAWLLPVWVAAFGVVLVAAARQGRPVAERLATGAGFALLPPLLAFGLYFGAGHAVRHLLRLGAWHNPRDPAAATRWLARVVLPAALASAAAIGALAWLGRDVAADVLAPCFRVIAALTLPHMLVTAWLESGPERASGRAGAGRAPPLAGQQADGGAHGR